MGNSFDALSDKENRFKEDEDDENSKFSVEELAIILDMDEEEIRDVLRLTGDDK